MAQIAEFFLQNSSSGFVLLRIFRSTLSENKEHNLFFFFFLAVFVTAISFCMTHHHDLKYVAFYLGSAQNSNFYPTIFLYIYWLK